VGPLDAGDHDGWDRWTPETTSGVSLRLESVHSDTYRAVAVVIPEDRLI
jgi:hypothetical protein